MTWDGMEQLREAVSRPGAKKALADAVGVTPDRVTRWLSGTRPKDDEMPAIEDAIGVGRGALGRASWRGEAAVLRDQIDLLTQVVERLNARVDLQDDELKKLRRQRARGPARSVE